MLELVFVRHGQTDSNARNTYLGWTDIELNDMGRSQAKHAAKRLEDESFCKIYSSPLLRAQQTTTIIINNYSQITLLDDLKERNFGQWEDLIYDEIRQRFADEHDKWLADWVNFRITDGESGIEMYRRIDRAIKRIIEENIDYNESMNKDMVKKVLIVTHSGAIKMSVSHLLGLGIEGMWRFVVDHGSITRVTIKDGYAVLKCLNT